MNIDIIPLILKLLVLSLHQITTDMSLEKADDSRQPFVTHILKITEDASLEEDLGASNLVLVGVNLDGGKDLLSCNLGVDEAFRDGIGSKDGVSENGENIFYFITVFKLYIYFLNTDQNI